MSKHLFFRASEEYSSFNVGHPVGCKRVVMKVAFTFLFLLFYVASSYAITQERISLAVEAVQASSSRDNKSQVDEKPDQAAKGFPNYRQAKPKTGSDLYLIDTEAVSHLPRVSTTSFEPQSVSFKSLFSLESILDRAPPAQRQAAEGV
jgi:hypothetical protein